jgi:hypothetical protein
VVAPVASLEDAVDELVVDPTAMLDVATGAGVEAAGAIEVAGAVLCTGSGVGSGTGTGLMLAGADAAVVPLELVDDDDVVEDVELEVLVDDELGDVVVAAVAGAVGAVVVDGVVTGAVAVVDEALDFNVSEPAPPLNTTGIVDCSDTA